MKKSLISIISVLSVVLCADPAQIVKMAVFPDNTVFTVRKGVIPDGMDSLSFFEDVQFFKGSFNVWSEDVQFGVRNMPQKKFNSSIYSNPNLAFANQNVVVTLKTIGSKEHIISGKLVKIENPENPYEIPDVIAIEDNSSKNITYVRTHDIETIRAEKADFMSSTVPASCWIFSRRNKKNALPFEFSYLANGIAWQSAVKLDLVSKDKMNITHNAVIRNNGKKFECPEFYLVSGSPEISTKNVISLLCQAAQSRKERAVKTFARANYAMMQDAAVAEGAMSFVSQTSDILYRNIGKIALDENESREIKLQSAANVPYRTVVKWQIPAQRNLYGKTNGNSAQSAENTLIFKNLCPSMLDSAPVAIYADGKLMMLTELNSNTPVNAERSIILSKADGIECNIKENELVKNRVQNVIFNNRRYVKCTVEAILTVKNFRKISAPVVIDYNFNGEYVKCENMQGKLTQKADYSSLLNPAGNLNFEFELKPAETKEIKVTYTILTAL